MALRASPVADDSDLAEYGPVHHNSGSLPVTLARLTGEFLDLSNLLADTDPSDAEGIAQVEKLLDGSAAAIQEKAVAIASLVREFEARAVAAQAEADRIMAHARTATSRARWLKEYLLNNLHALGVPRIQTPTMLVVVGKSPPAVEILDEEQIPDTYKRLVQSVDKNLLRTALMTGEVVPGARLIRGSHLSIR